MGISKVLKKFNIKVVQKIKKEQQIVLVDNVVTKITNSIKDIDYAYMYNKLMMTSMYIAIIPEGISKAIYSYEENILFISDEEDIQNVSKELLYECIHAIQDIRDKKGKVKQLGQCMFSDFKVYGMALNEVCVQYIVSKVFNEKEEFVEAYGIKAKTFSINKYPLICNVLEQLIYILNEKELIRSTIYSTDEFIIDCIEQLGGQGTFANIQSNLDEMLYTSEEIIGIKKKAIDRAKDGYIEEIDRQLNKIYEKEKLIQKLYMDCQMLIFTTYFDKLYNRIQIDYDIRFYRDKLKEYKALTGRFINEEQEYFIQYYNQYCSQKEEKLILKEAELQRKKELALIVVPDNTFMQIFNSMKQLLRKILKKI